MKKFNLKDRVMIKSQMGYPTFAPYTVVAALTDNYYVVEDKHGNVVKRKSNDLIDEAEALAIKQEKEAKKRKLEEEFSAARALIKTKLDQAATLIEESTELAHRHNKNLRDLYEETEKVMMAIGDSEISEAWSSSSANC